MNITHYGPAPHSKENAADNHGGEQHLLVRQRYFARSRREAPGEPKLPTRAVSADQQAQLKTINELFNKGLSLLQTNQAFAARTPLEKAAQLAPRSAAVHCNLGLAYQNSGNLLKAAGEYQEALKLHPRMPEATLNLAGCYQCSGKLALSLAWYQRFLDENPQAPESRQVCDLIKLLQTNAQNASSASAVSPQAQAKFQDYYIAVTANGVFRWDQSALPIKVFVFDGKSVPGFRPQFKDILASAFEEWVTASGGKVSYLLVDQPANADIVCDWTNNPADVKGDGTQGERGMAQIFAENHVIKRASIRILTKALLSATTLSDDDLKKACLHEIGHALGLQGHSTNNHDVMFFTVDTPTVWPVLSKRDKNTILRLYR